MQIAVACWDVRGIRKEMKGGDGGAKKKKKAEGAKAQDLEAAAMFFKSLCVLDPPPAPLHACLAAVTECATCHRTPQRSTR